MTVIFSGPVYGMRAAGEDGEVVFRGLPPGEYELTVGTADYASPDAHVTVGEDEAPPAVEIRLVRGGRLLLDFAERDRAALLAARIVLVDATDTEVTLIRDESGAHDRITPRLLPGKYRVVVAAEGREPRAVGVAIEDGKDARLVLEAE
jgi:hypothetical protein